MSKTQNPIIGAASGKFGTAVLSRSLGKNIIRTVPITGNAIPSDAQLEQRAKIATLGSFAEKAPNFLFLGLGAQSYPISAQNKFMKLNKDNLQGSYPSFTISLEDLVLCTGQRATLKVFEASVTILNKTIDATWDKAVDYGVGLSTDNIHVIVMDTSTGKVAEFLNVATRNDETFSVALPAGFDENTISFEVILTAAAFTVPAPKKRRIIRLQQRNELATKVK